VIFDSKLYNELKNKPIKDSLTILNKEKQKSLFLTDEEKGEIF
jgi:hypothetical protein